MPKNGLNVSLNSYDDIFSTEETRQFCPKCNIKLYRMTADCTGFIHIKCWRCREMLWLNLSIRAK